MVMLANRLPLIVERSETGQFMRESDFDMAVARCTRELVRRYGIKFDRNRVVPADDDLADRAYRAGMDLFLEMGVYNQSTERRIRFDRAEVEAALATLPGAVTLGAGRDAVVMRHLEVEGTMPAIVHSGPTGTPCSERCHPLILLSCAQEPLVDCLGAGSVSTYMSVPIVPGSPTEILAARRDAAVARDVVRKAGRPGMHINDVAVPLNCAGKMATVDPQSGLRPSDAFLVSQLPELKTSYDQLSRVAFMLGAGIHIVDLNTPLVGGIAGGPEGTAVAEVAAHILGVVLYHCSYHICGPMSLRWSHSTDRAGLWVLAVSGQALSRNTATVTASTIYTRAGLCTEQVLWEVAAGSLVTRVCGLNQLGVGATGGSCCDHTSGLEARFNAEVTHASLGLTRDDANELVLAMLPHYENHAADPDPGKPFAEIYDLDTIEPSSEWLDLYGQARHATEALGLDLNAWKKVFYARNSR
jgi:methylamine--corrinoid protein Co-methyltransferase